MVDATQLGLGRTAVFVLWAMHHRWILLPDQGSPDAAPNPVFMHLASTGGLLCANVDVLPFDESAGTLPDANKTCKGRNSG